MTEEFQMYPGPVIALFIVKLHCLFPVNSNINLNTCYSLGCKAWEVAGYYKFRGDDK